jgi:hypothetical protein
VYYGGRGVQEGGTSLAAPLFTGMMAVANRYASLIGANQVGFAAPTFYNCGNNVISGCSASLHDVTSGTTYGAVAYAAGQGFDQASGWGSVDWWSFVQKIVGAAPGGSPTATVVPSTPVVVSMFRREIDFMCSSWMLWRKYATGMSRHQHPFTYSPKQKKEVLSTNVPTCFGTGRKAPIKTLESSMTRATLSRIITTCGGT